MTRYRHILLVLVIGALAACNGGGDGNGDQPDDVVTSEAADDAATTPAAPDGGNGGNGGNDGGEDGDECRFATIDEVSAALGVDVADATVAGESCTYHDADGESLVGYVYITQGGRATYEDQREGGAEVIDGIADGALYFPGGGMYVLKGDAILNMTIFSGASLGEDDAALREPLIEVARVVARRM